MSLSKKVKNGVKKAVAWIDNFEQTAAELAIEKGYKYVICGHIHQPQKRVIETEKGSVIYMNSGDWIENLTSLEYSNGNWNLYHYQEQDFASAPVVSLPVRMKEVEVVTEEVSMHIHSLPFTS
jgi:UDP-2,3-diacylglucosamine pyrophosphatase LpxH